MEINLDASIDRQRILWVATCARFPEFIAEARTVDELRGKFADALEAADLPGDTKLDVRFHYDHGTRAAAVFAATLSAVDSSDGEVESEAAGDNAGVPRRALVIHNARALLRHRSEARQACAMDSTDDDPRALYPFDLFDPIRKRWHRARWKATKADIEARGGRITGPGYVPTGGGQFMPPTGRDRTG